jgi:hypothetical protein
MIAPWGRFLINVVAIGLAVLFANRSRAEDACLGVFQYAPRVVTDTTNKYSAFLNFGHTLCSSSWETIQSSANSNSDLGIALFNIIGISGSNSDAEQKYTAWQQANCQSTELKSDIREEFNQKQSYVSQQVYASYKACLEEANKQTGVICQYIPTNDAHRGWLYIDFTPTELATRSAPLEQPIALAHGVWGVTPQSTTLPASTLIKRGNNYFPIILSDICAGDTLTVSVKGYVGECAVEIPPWPSFTATMKETASYTQIRTARIAPKQRVYDPGRGYGPDFFCAFEDDARKALNWPTGPFEYISTAPQAQAVVQQPFGRNVTKDLASFKYNQMDTKCGYFGIGPQVNAVITYSFQVVGTRTVSLTTFTPTQSSEPNSRYGNMLTFAAGSWSLPADAAPGTTLSFAYDIDISENTGASPPPPPIHLSNTAPAAGGFRSSIDLGGLVTVVRQ